MLSLSNHDSDFQPKLQLPQDTDVKDADLSKIQPRDPEISLKEGKPVPQARGDVVIVFPRGIAALEPKQIPFPAQLLITVEDTVTWKNEDIVAHTVTSGFPQQEELAGEIFDSGLISPGDSFSHKFSSPDINGHHSFVGYGYFCSVHPWMTGNITVQFFEE
jgi:plastocyanin